MSTGVDLRVAARVIKDQGRRGTCVACAATAAHEMVRAEDIELSIEFLHWAAKRCDGLPASSEGTTLSAARTALSRDGQPPESSWPYDDGRDALSVQYAPPPGAVAEASRRLLLGGQKIDPTSAALRESLDRGEPVILGLRIHDAWMMTGTSGQIMTPSPGTPNLGGHAAVAVGYQGNEFIIQNSWGSGWGDNGYGYLHEDYVDRYGVAAWALAL